MYFKFVDAEVECVSFQYNDTENIFEMKDRMDFSYTGVNV